MIELEERFWSKVNILGPDECWEWQDKPRPNGYGTMRWYKGKRPGAHRIAYELTYGVLPPYDPENPIVVRHKCDNKSCCNPSHLELGTHSDNILDQVIRGRHAQSSKTHCPKGHQYDEVNTRNVTTTRGGPGRVCRKCHRDREREARRWA